MSERDKPLELQSCEFCGIGRLCLSTDLLGGDLQQLKPVVESRFAVPRRQPLYRTQTRQSAVYVVKSGSLKTCEVDADGDEQVLDFYLPGDVLGLEDLAVGHHEADAIALEDSWICAVPLPRLNQRALGDGVVFREMFSVVCRKLHQQRQMIHQLGKVDATARLAGFLLDLSRRLRSRGLRDDRFRLSMDRVDIASYLRTTLETVSRSFSALQKSGLIDVSAKEVHILDMERLAEEFGEFPLATEQSASAEAG